MNHTLLLSALFLGVMPASARVRSTAQLQQLAASALMAHDSGSGMRKVKSAQDLIPQLQQVQLTDQLVMLTAEGAGTVFMSRDDDYEAVLGVTSTSYDGMLPQNLMWWVQTTEATLRHRTMQGMGDLYTIEATAPSNKPNFMRTKWGQDAPYNNACPRAGGILTKAGCVATSMAQILNYYQYPEKLNGSTGYIYYVTDNRGDTEERSSRLWFGGKYDWANMLDTYTRDGYTEAQGKAVANLMRDCGYAVHMGYGTDSSGSSEFDIPAAFSRNFSCDSMQVGVHFRDFYTDSEWTDMIYTELEAGHPILACGGNESEGGHAFVFTGMQTNGRVYVNWGWEGAYDGFFSLKYLRPVTGNFSDMQNSVVLGVRPQLATPGEVRGRYAKSLWAMPINPTVEVTEGHGLTFTTEGLYNFNALTFIGNVVFTLVNKNDPEDGYIYYIFSDEPYEDGSIDVMPPFYGFSIKGRQTIDFAELFGPMTPNATYTITMRSWADNEDSPSFVRVPGGYMMYDFTTDAQGRPASVAQIDPAVAIEVGIQPIPAAIRPTAGGTYNLAGQRIARPHKGINIIDGKKVLVN